MKQKSPAQVVAAVTDAVARIIVEDGTNAVSVASVRDRAAVTDAQIYRMYRSRSDLFAGVLEEGYLRVQRVCRTPRVRGIDGLDAAIELTYDLLDQSRTDPVAHALYALQSTPSAAGFEHGPIYDLWRAALTEMVLGDGDRDCDPMVADTDHRRVVEVFDVWVGVLAGLCASPVSTARDASAHDRLHLMLRGLVPALCSTPDQGRHMVGYLDRLHEQVFVDSGIDDRLTSMTPEVLPSAP